MNRSLVTSKHVILDCVLENGAIVAANATKPYYPAVTKNYFYVWPRDGAFACMALDVLGVSTVQERFFSFLSSRVAGWKESGLFYEKYYPNGEMVISKKKFQPDQTGEVLIAVWHHFKDKKSGVEKYKKLVTHSADGLCNVWDGKTIKLVSNDVWEERLSFSDLREDFTYSLAACVRGLECANKLFPNKRYVKVAKEMKATIMKKARKYNYFVRSIGVLDDLHIDASMLGLMWPFTIVDAKSSIARNTVKEIEKKLVSNYGVHRYEHDVYDGWMYQGMHRKKGAGWWPLLNFWMSIVLHDQGKKVEARKYFDKALGSSKKYLAEQVFDNDIQKAVSPLGWSHSMHILAASELGLLD